MSISCPIFPAQKGYNAFLRPFCWCGICRQQVHMKSIIFLATTFTLLICHAEPARSKIDTLMFFETLIHQNPKHPANKRDPSWPDRLTIRPIKPKSKAEFETILKGTWKTVYHCEGAPALHSNQLFDGKELNGFLETVYDAQTFNEYEIINGEKEWRRKRNYTISEEGNGEFALYYNNRTTIVSFVRIKENGQIGMLSEEATNEFDHLCPEGTVFQQLEIRLGEVPLL